jgi:hypothetical protein
MYPQEDLLYFENTLRAVEEFSRDAHVFVLVHKMDLIEENRQEVFDEKKVSWNIVPFANYIQTVHIYLHVIYLCICIHVRVHTCISGE